MAAYAAKTATVVAVVPVGIRAMAEMEVTV
jgi:hypothetical protein